MFNTFKVQTYTIRRDRDAQGKFSKGAVKTVLGQLHRLDDKAQTTTVLDAETGKPFTFASDDLMCVK